MAEETTPPPAAPNESRKLGATASIRFRNPDEQARFERVYNARNRRGKSKNVSDFIWQMFEYIEKNPYGDFPTR